MIQNIPSLIMFRRKVKKNLFIFVNFHEAYFRDLATLFCEKNLGTPLHVSFKEFFYGGELWTDLNELSNPKDLILAPNFLGDFTCLSDSLATVHATYYKDFQLMMDRFSLEKYPNIITLSYYNHLLAYWNKKILNSEFPIKAIFFDSTPHFPWDLTLFVVAKTLKIKIIILKNTKLKGRIMLSSEILNTSFYEIYQDRQIDLEELDNFLLEDSYWQQYKSNYLIVRYFKYIKRFFYSLNRFIYRFLTNYNRKHPYFNLTRIEYASYVFRYFWRYTKIAFFFMSYWGLDILKSSTFFSDQVHDKDLYVALHYQPERSTLPEAGIFSDQISAIRHLSQNTPENVNIFIKEHPKQVTFFDLKLQKFSYRSDIFYKSLASIPKVILIPSFVIADQVIDRVGVVVSATGSVLWEACKKGKPSISLAPTWLTGNGSVLELSKFNENVSIDNLFAKSKEQVVLDSRDHMRNIYKYLINAPFGNSSANKDLSQLNIYMKNLTDAFTAIINNPSK
jgi:hypothetical protein